MTSLNDLERVGDYLLGRTVGSGSMGTVKLGTHVASGTSYAIKLVPRGLADTTTLREATVTSLLHHPYICGLKELVSVPEGHCLVFEYINAGHLPAFGRLAQRVARKFARQIGSAIAYCHANNVVHRDLKLDNLLISTSGNVKIIDFGFTNLFDPERHLHTGCGSLHFVAPELLHERPYVGPEVDVWSFGVILFVLVCGYLPFDDPSIPDLHVKIKRGHVDYPPWIPTECKTLLQRMLHPDPHKRAHLSEVLTHPWMTRGSSGPPQSHIPEREPLRADSLDPHVLRELAARGLGDARSLQAILSSPAYLTAVERFDSPSCEAMPAEDDTSDPPPPRNRSFSNLARRTMNALRRLPPSGAVAGDSPEDADADTPSSDDPDPTRGFHPLISMYYLIAERQARAKAGLGGAFASSTASLVKKKAGTSKPALSPKRSFVAAKPTPHRYNTS